MDGGLGQVHAAQDVLTALKLDIPVAGMVKDDKHRDENEFARPHVDPRSGITETVAHHTADDVNETVLGASVLKGVLVPFRS